MSCSAIICLHLGWLCLSALSCNDKLASFWFVFANSDPKGCVVFQGAAAEDDLEEEEIEFSDDEKVSLKLNLLSCMLFIDGP